MLMCIMILAANHRFKKKKKKLLSWNELVYFAKEEHYTITAHFRSN